MWIGDQTLRNQFPRLYALEEEKGVSVSSKFSQPLDSLFRRRVMGGVESVQWGVLQDLMESTALNTTGDKWVWELDSMGCFFLFIPLKV